MSNLTLPILILTTAVGYFFSKDGKNTRQTKKKDTLVEKFDKNIYESDMVREVNAEMLERSLSNYKKAEDPANTGIIPPLFNTYSVAGNDSILTGETNGKIIKELVVEKENKKKIDIDNRPMFNEMKFGTERIDDDSKRDEEISLLTGLPLERNHKNMVPFFGSNSKQNVEKFTNETILESHTGNTGLYKHKKEALPLFNKVPENIFGTPVETVYTETERYIPSMFKQNEKPFDEQMISAKKEGTIENKIRPVFKDVNNLRVETNPKESYEGRIKIGKFGDLRGVQGEFKKQRAETFYEKNIDHLFKTNGQYIATKSKENFENLKTGNEIYNVDYIGNSSAINQKEQIRSQMQDPRRINFSKGALETTERNSNGYIINKSANDYGKDTYTNYDTERGDENDMGLLTSNLQMTTNSGKKHFTDSAKTTFRETFGEQDEESKRNVKTQFDKGMMDAYNNGMLDQTPRVTHKENTIVNNYNGIVNKQEGMGYLINKYEVETTNKQINIENTNYTGNANRDIKTASVYTTYENPEKVRNAIHTENYKGTAIGSNKELSRTNYNNAETRDNKEIIANRKHISGPQNFQISGGQETIGKVKTHANTLFKEMEGKRKPVIHNLINVLPSTQTMGMKTRMGNDIGTLENKLEPELIINQHNQNPYSLYGNKIKK